jgi:hypothetical protein
MPTKEPVVLLVLVETTRLRWRVAGIGLDGQAFPLLRSEDGDLAAYQELGFDEQVSFLRHRFCGVLQRGCDRLHARDKKACQFVLVFEGLLPGEKGELTRGVADHFVQWMLNPPVALFTSATGFGPEPPPDLNRIAGELPPELERLLHARLGELLAARDDEKAWELARKKGT